MLVVSSLWRIWDTTSLSLSLKIRLLKTLVNSVLLYNCECWAIEAKEVQRLESTYFQFLRCLTRHARGVDPTSGEVDKASYADVYAAAQTPCIARLLRERRLRFLGHLARAPIGDPEKRSWLPKSTVRQSGAAWWKTICGALGRAWAISTTSRSTKKAGLSAAARIRNMESTAYAEG